MFGKVNPSHPDKVAAEQLGRKARLMEYDPHYSDVIIARWEKLTGQKAQKIEGV